MRPCRLDDITAEIEHSLDFLESNMQDIPERQRSMRAVFDYYEFGQQVINPTLARWTFRSTLPFATIGNKVGAARERAQSMEIWQTVQELLDNHTE